MAKPRYFCVFVALTAAATTAEAVVIEFFDEDRDEWFASVLAVTTIGFTRFPHGTYLTNQYQDLGVLFLDGDDAILCCSESTFPQDGAGLDGNAAIHLLFASPRRWIAFDFPGELQIDLFFEGNPIYESSFFGSSGAGRFGGLISTLPFDEAILVDPCAGQANLDDLHFGFLPLGDLDGDGTVGVTDLLALLSAWGSCPIACPPDLDGNDVVSRTDVVELLAAWGANPGHPADFDNDGFVGVIDLLWLLAAWGSCPPPIPCLADIDFDGMVGVTDLLILLGNWG